MTSEGGLQVQRTAALEAEVAAARQQARASARRQLQLTTALEAAKRQAAPAQAVPPGGLRRRQERLWSAPPQRQAKWADGDTRRVLQGELTAGGAAVPWCGIFWKLLSTAPRLPGALRVCPGRPRSLASV